MKKLSSHLFSRLLTAVIALTMLVSFPAIAHAEEDAQYASTKAFLSKLEEEDLKYTYFGLDADDDEKVVVSFNDSDYGSIVFTFFFDKECETVSMRIWELVKVGAGKTYTYGIVNQLNNAYKYAKFVFDESDSTITCSMDSYLTKDTAGMVSYSMMDVLLQILSDSSCVDQLKTLQ